MNTNGGFPTVNEELYYTLCRLYIVTTAIFHSSIGADICLLESEQQMLVEKVNRIAPWLKQEAKKLTVKL